MPRERVCGTCVYWDGDRSGPADKANRGLCHYLLPPFIHRAINTVETGFAEKCSFHEYDR